MILVLGGTSEGREVTACLEERGFPVLLTTATAFGGEMARRQGVPRVQSRPLNLDGFLDLLNQGAVRAIVDATHPYAVQVSQTAMEACRLTATPYLRYERPAWEAPRHPLLLPAPDYQGAVEILKDLGPTVLITTGSKNLKFFARAPQLEGKRLAARVLPLPEVLKECLDLDLRPENLIAAQGPFTVEANLWMIRHFEAAAVVSKESGEAGGVEAKWAACLKLGVPLVLIKRPALDYPAATADLNDLLVFLAQRLN